MSKKNLFQMEGKITEVQPNNIYKIELENKHNIVAYAAGKVKRAKLQILPGDDVKVEMSTYDLNRGRIVKRLS